MIDESISMVIRVMIRQEQVELLGEKKNCPVSSLYATNPTWTGLRLNPVIQVARPTSNCQSRCTEHFVPSDCNKKVKDDNAASILRIVKVNDACLESAKPVSIWPDLCKTDRLKKITLATNLNLIPGT